MALEDRKDVKKPRNRSAAAYDAVRAEVREQWQAQGEPVRITSAKFRREVSARWEEVSSTVETKAMYQGIAEQRKLNNDGEHSSSLAAFENKFQPSKTN